MTKVSESPIPTMANPDVTDSWVQSVGAGLQNRPFLPTITPDLGVFTHDESVWSGGRYQIYRLVNRLCVVVFNVTGTLSLAANYVDMDLPIAALQGVTIPVGVNNIGIDYVAAARVSGAVARISLNAPFIPGACEFSGHLTYFTT